MISPILVNNLLSNQEEAKIMEKKRRNRMLIDSEFYFDELFNGQKYLNYITANVLHKLEFQTLLNKCKHIKLVVILDNKNFKQYFDNILTIDAIKIFVDAGGTLEIFTNLERKKFFEQFEDVKINIVDINDLKSSYFFVTTEYDITMFAPTKENQFFWEKREVKGWLFPKIKKSQGYFKVGDLIFGNSRQYKEQILNIINSLKVNINEKD